jgi:NADH-quinone oxidoreductase subunit N
MGAVNTQIAEALYLVRAEALLSAAACLYFLLAVTVTLPARAWGRISLIVMLVSLLWLPTSSSSAPASLAAAFRLDDFALYARWLSFGFGLLYILLCQDRVAEGYAAEFYGCVLIIIAGLGLAASANDLVMLFLALEFVSIPAYILLYLQRADNTAQEATIKYFFLSVFSAALFLYGLSMLYGATGTTNLQAIRAAVAAAAAGDALGPGLPAVLLVSLVMMTAGLCFRLTAAPFHFYAPDVYQGAPTLPVTLLANVPKIAGIIGLYQLVALTLVAPGGAGLTTALAPQAGALFWILALVSMVIGNWLGLWQDDWKRLFAYSSVAHAGYLLVGLAAGPAGAQPDVLIDGATAVLFYLVVYVLMVLGAFAAIVAVETRDRPIRAIDELAGLGKAHPLLALALAICLFSLTGLPPTAGFLAKFNIFLAAWSTGQWLHQLLAVLMAANAAVGAWYYLRIVGVMYLRDAVRPLPPRTSPAAGLTACICAALLLYFFLAPGAIVRSASQAAHPPAAVMKPEQHPGGMPSR